MPIIIANIIKLISESNRNNIPLIVTQPGSGICSAIENVMEEQNSRAFIVNCGEMAKRIDPAGLLDANAPIGLVATNHLTPTIVDAVEYAENHPDEQPVLIMDELNMSHPGIISKCANIALTRSFNGMNLPDNLKIVFLSRDDVNFPEDLPGAFINRLCTYRT